MSEAAGQARAAFERGLSLHRQSRLGEAEQCYRQALALQPQNFDALHLLGVIALQQNRAQAALDLIDRALRVNPSNAAAYISMGNARYQLGQHAAAVENYDKALALKPAEEIDAHFNRGAALLELNQVEAAIVSFDRAIAVAPNRAEFHYNRGVALSRLKQFESAVESYDRAILAGFPGAAAHNNRAIALFELQEYEAAVAGYDQAIAIQPSDAQAHSNRGNALRKLERHEAALASSAAALRLQPRNPQWHYNLGTILLDLRRFAEAARSYDAALRLDPTLPEAHYNRGIALHELTQYDEAVASHDRALANRPGFADALYCRGNSLRELKRYEAAVSSYDRAAAINPELRFLIARWYLKMQTCDWDGFDTATAEIAAALGRGEHPSNPFFVLSLSDSASLQYSAAKSWVGRMDGRVAALPPIRRRSFSGKLKIGYFSADFRDHPVASLVAQVIELHDRKRCEVTGISIGPDTRDEMRLRMENAFDRFIDVGRKSDRDIALTAREMELDIAVDLGGHTQYSRPLAFAFRAAPLQVSFLGYPGTMGGEFIDYLVADRTTVPVESRHLYAEKIIYLPDVCLPVDARRVAQARDFSRAELGLPPEGFVYCCFNNTCKITPGVFQSWTRILKCVDGSVLWLSEGNPKSRENLRSEAAARGVDPARLIFAPRMPSLAEHLARHRMADLFLDTLPYNAHSTAVDSLLSGVPILTCVGEAFAARVAASLLRVAEMPELVTASREQYEDRAVALARNPQLMLELKTRLADRERLGRCFDVRRFTSHLEEAYERIHERYRRELPAEHLSVGPPAG
jgi:protein O-GlcNAc transferase